MKSLFVVASCIAAALAQNIAIGAPLEGSSVSAGSNFTVEVDRPNSLTGSEEVSIVIALESCASYPNASCSSFDVTQVLGRILYSGPYDPQYQSSAPGWKPPHQNFSVQVPANIAKGEASLTVTHLSLVGAGPFPYFQVVNSTINVE